MTRTPRASSVRPARAPGPVNVGGTPESFCDSRAYALEGAVRATTNPRLLKTHGVRIVRMGGDH